VNGQILARRTWREVIGVRDGIGFAQLCVTTRRLSDADVRKSGTGLAP
jgi:hypothetical protein